MQQAQTLYSIKKAQSSLGGALDKPLIQTGGGGAFSNNRNDDDWSSSEGDVESGYSGSDDGSDLNADLDETQPMTLGKGIWMFTVFAAVIGGLSSSVVSLALEKSVLTYIAGGAFLVMSPVVVRSEIKRLSLPSQRRLVQALQADANELMTENEKLTERVDNLENEVERTKKCEDELAEIATKQGKSVEQLVNLVSENDTLLKGMRSNMRQKILQDIIGLCIKSDRDGDFEIDEKELVLLILRLKTQIEPEGVKFDADKFREAVRDNRSVAGVVSTVRDMLKSEDDMDVGGGGGEGGGDDDSYVDENVMFKITCGSNKNFKM